MIDTQQMSQLRQALDLRRQAKDGRYYHNAKELLEVYRGILWQLHNGIQDTEMESLDSGYGHVHQALDLLASGLEDDLSLIRLQDQCKSMLFTRALIQLADKALLALKQYPGDGERYFDLLNRLYILEYPYSEGELLDSMNISRRTLYREKRIAVSMFGAILWGLLLPRILAGGMDDTEMALIRHNDNADKALICD